MCKHRFGVQLLQNPPLCSSTVSKPNEPDLKLVSQLTGNAVHLRVARHGSRVEEDPGKEEESGHAHQQPARLHRVDGQLRLPGQQRSQPEVTSGGAHF
jgi:hypothetical protein